MKYTLLEPVQVGDSGPTVTDLVFREKVVAGDLRGLTDDGVGSTLKLAGRLCAQPDAVMNALGLADLEGVSALVEGFIEKSRAAGRQTGTKP